MNGIFVGILNMLLLLTFLGSFFTGVLIRKSPKFLIPHKIISKIFFVLVILHLLVVWRII